MKMKIQFCLVTILVVIFIRGSISGPLSRQKVSLRSTESTEETKGLIHDPILTSQVSRRDFESRSDKKDKTNIEFQITEEDSNNSQSYKFTSIEGNIFNEETDIEYEDVSDILRESKEMLTFETEGSGFDFNKDFIGLKEKGFEMEGSGENEFEEQKEIKEKVTLGKRKGKNGFLNKKENEINLNFTNKEDENIPNQTPLMITTLNPFLEDEWLKIINSSPKESDKPSSSVLDLVDELLRLDIKSQPTLLPPIDKNFTEIDPFEEFEELTTISTTQIEENTLEVITNGKFTSENMSFIETENKFIESENKSNFKELDNIISTEDTKSDLKHTNLNEDLLKIYSNLKQDQKFKSLKNSNLNLLQYDIKHLLKNINSSIPQKINTTKDVTLTKTKNHSFLKSELSSDEDNIKICFFGTIGYQFIFNKIDSPKYLDEFHKICINSYEPTLIIEQESSLLEFKFKLIHDTINLQNIHIKINGKDEINNVFTENLIGFNVLIGGDIQIDELKLGNFNNREEGLNLLLFNVHLSTEMYLNGRLMADSFEGDEIEENGATTLIVSTSIGVFSVSFLVIFVLIYQFCLKNKSRKMIYILTHR